MSKYAPRKRYRSQITFPHIAITISDVMDDKPYLRIVAHYEACLARHGDNHLGVDWPTSQEAETRYEVMLNVIRSEHRDRFLRLLDFGCGTSHLYEYLIAQELENIAYSGLELSRTFYTISCRKFPLNTYYFGDLLENDAIIPTFDYIVINGVFTEKQSLTFDEMSSYFRTLVKRLFAKAETAVAFNVMSKHVDWERDDLFHLPFDELASFLKREVSRNFVFRNDYGLHEYTTYVYR